MAITAISNGPLNPGARAFVLSSLVESYTADVEALIARYPAQAANRAHLMARVAGAKIGRVRRPIATKLGLAADLGELVLVWDPAFDPDPRFAGSSLVFWSFRTKIDTSFRSCEGSIEIVG